MRKPAKFSISALSAECGIDRRTLGRLLADAEPVRKNGRDHYTLRQVVAAIRAGGIRAQEAEKTRLYSAQADHEELRVRELAQNLLPAEVVDATWRSKVSHARATLRPLPKRVARATLAAKTPREAEDAARTEVYAALNELAAG